MKTPKKHETNNSTFDVIKKHSRKITTATAFTILLITSSFAPRLCATAGVKQQAPASTKQVKKEPRPKNNRRIKSLPKKHSLTKATTTEEKIKTEKRSDFEEKTEAEKRSGFEEKILEAEEKNPGILNEIIELADHLNDLGEDICMGYAIRTIDPLNYSPFDDLIKTFNKLSKKLSTAEIATNKTNLAATLFKICPSEMITNNIESYAQILTENLNEIPVYERMIMLENLKKSIAQNPKLRANIEDYIDTLANHPNYIDTEERTQQRLDYIVKILQKTYYPDEEFLLTEDQETHYQDLLDLMEYQEGEIKEVPEPKESQITETEEINEELTEEHIEKVNTLGYLIELLQKTTGNYQNALNEYQKDQSIENQIQLLCEKNNVHTIWLNIFKITSSTNINLDSLDFPMYLLNIQGQMTMEYMSQMIDDHHLTDDEKDFLKNNNETCGF